MPPSLAPLGDNRKTLDLAVNEEFLGIGNLGRAKRPIRLEELVDFRHNDRTIVVRNEL